MEKQEATLIVVVGECLSIKNMKRSSFLLCLILVAAIVYLSSCKKNNNAPTGSTPVSFVGTEYASMGTFDAFGKPDYLVETDVISTNLLSFINTNLPESKDLRNSHPEYLTGNGNFDLSIVSKSDVWITFVSEGTGFLNTVGYYTYAAGSPPAKAADIKKITYVFPNASLASDGGKLNPGDKVKLGSFEPGTVIGFVLLKSGWNGTNVNKDAVHFCSNEALNPENNPAVKRHAVLINYSTENKFILGFEDIDRSDAKCDHDFNDVVLYATVKAATN